MALRGLFCVSVITTLMGKTVGNLGVEPKCPKFDFEERLLEKMVQMEQSVKLMDDRIDIFNKLVLAVKQDMGKLEHETDTELDRVEGLVKELRWEEWGQWSQCTAHCKDGVGDRLQSRTRNKKDSNELKSTQNETRPCSSVQFAGCISPQNGDQFFAVAYDYQHVLAQSTCTAMAPAGRVRAVRRTCSNDGPDCNAVCKKAGTTCFNALHVYSDANWVTPLERQTVEQTSLEIHKYNGCGGQYCGPNFCCCK